MLLRIAGRRYSRRSLSSLIATTANAPTTLHDRPGRTRWSTTHARTPSEGRRAQLRRAKEPAPPTSRSLASLAGPGVDPTASSLYTPIQHGQRPDFRWDYPAHNPSDPLLVELNRETPAQRRTLLGSSTGDFLQNFYACLQVRRFDRAENIIKRLLDLPEANDFEITHAHEAYLQARFQHIASPPGLDHNFSDMRKWYSEFRLEEEENASQVSITMIRAALVASDITSRSDIVREYVAHSRLSTEDLLDRDIWSDEEYDMLEAFQQHKEIPSSVAAIEPPEPIMPSPQSQPRYFLREEDVPQVLQVYQKGASMPTLKSVLDYQTQEYASPEFAQQSDARAQESRSYERQRMLEDLTGKAALERWKVEEEGLQSMGIKSVLSSKPINALMWQWYSDMIPLLEEELQQVKSRIGKDLKRLPGPKQSADSYAIYLESMTADKLALSTVIFIMSTLFEGKNRQTAEFTNTVRLGDAAKRLGQYIEDEVLSTMAQAKSRGKKRKRGQSSLAEARLNRRRATSKASLQDHVEWPVSVKVHIGAMLIAKFLQIAKMNITREHPRTKQPVTRLRQAFAHKITYQRGRRQSLLQPCGDLRDKVLREPLGAYVSKRLPMLTEPQPWVAFKDGAYLSSPVDFVRLPPSDRTPREYALAAIEKGHMQQIFDAINALSKIPWQINENILRIQIDAWNTGEAIANLAPLNPEYEYPPEPPPSEDPTKRAKWIMECQELDNKKSGYHSQRCHQNLQLEIARAFRNDTIYFPHNVDFRGRAYPIPPYLNHMGADNVRALMIFDKGKPLGDNGLRWLKIHLANVFGYDKASFTEREEFAMQHIDDIRDSVAKPLTGGRWWLKSDDAWQTLAACFELVAALDSPDPTKFVSHLPTHQDGTCNGLQHYAALGGDEAGARQVNLEPGDRPSDVYTAVAEGVIASIKKDLETGNPIAKIVDGRIARKLVKQPVMTNVYGVTYYGARAQVKKQLEDVFPEIKSGDLINHLTIASYIAKKIFNSLGEMFRGAQAIQEWLGLCADRIVTSVTREQIAAVEEALKMADEGTVTADMRKMIKDRSQFKSTVIWTTPLRFPVVQPYREASVKNLSTSLSTVTIAEPQMWDPVSRRKQMQGFPPNFIHSLDATHMMLSAIKCEEKGITFASIHDSFWTHACDRDELSDLLRDAFVHMHREDVVGRLKEEFEARYKGCLHMATIDHTTPLGRRVREWRDNTLPAYRKFGKFVKGLTLQDREMIIEYKRQNLLTSKDEAERQKGLEMVTPASIYEEMGKESDMDQPVSFANSRLGHTLEADMDEQDETTSECDLADDEVSAAAEDVLAANGQAGEASDVTSGLEEGDKQLTDAEFRQKWLNQNDKVVAGKSTLKSEKRMAIWLPLTFPDVPKKGSFDVRRLKQSKYFFH